MWAKLWTVGPQVYMRTVVPSAGEKLSAAPVSVFVNLSIAHDNIETMKRVAAILALFVAVVLAAAPPSQFQITVPVDLVDINFSATDKNGRMVPGLTADDFTIEEDGKKQQVSMFARERELPLTLALLVDISPSVEP